MTKSKKKWICCQLGAREHYSVARALDRMQALELLITDAWVPPTSPLRFLGGSLTSRFHPELRRANVSATNVGTLAFELRERLVRRRPWQKVIKRNSFFQKMVVDKLDNYSNEGPYTVMAYSYGARDIFRWARKQGWRTILGQIDPGPLEDEIVADLYGSDPSLKGDWERPPSSYWDEWREECMLSHYIVVNSEWSRSALIAEGVSQDKIKIIPLAYETLPAQKSFRRQFPDRFSKQRPLRALFLGSVNLRKGLGPLLNAIRSLSDEPIEFSIVGEVQMKVPEDLQYHSNIRWAGSVSRADTHRFYRDADLFLFPTKSDGFGITQLEAQAWKLPILTSKFCGDVVHDRRNGWLLSEVTSDAICSVLRECLDNPLILQEFSSNSGVAPRFDLMRVGEQWIDVFDHAL